MGTQHIVNENADLRLPRAGATFAVSITTSSAATQVTGSGGILTDLQAGKFLTLISDIDCWVLFGLSTISVDETSVSGADQCAKLTAGVPVHGKLPSELGGDCYVAVKGASAATAGLRIYVSSE